MSAPPHAALGSDDWSWQKDPGTMARLWRASINAQAALPEVLWSVGLRGLNDYPYPCSTPQVCPPPPRARPARAFLGALGSPPLARVQDCGRQISEAMANQTAWVRAVQVRRKGRGAWPARRCHPPTRASLRLAPLLAQPNASLVTYMWSEALGLLTAGLLVIPEGVRVIFTDAGTQGLPSFSRLPASLPACLRAWQARAGPASYRLSRPSPAGAGFIRTDANFSAYAHGVYYHTAMYDGNANQLTEMGAAAATGPPSPPRCPPTAAPALPLPPRSPRRPHRRAARRGDAEG